MNISIGEYSTVLNWWTICSISLACTIIFLIFYIRFLLKEIMRLSEFFIEINNEVLSFSSHLKSIHELEMFYGDETLNGLIKHSLYLMDKFEDFGEIIGFDNEEEEIEENEDDINDETKEKTDAPIPFKPQIFYGGTRKSDS